MPAAASDKTTFVVAPTSFLDIFCVDEEPNESVEPTRAGACSASPPRNPPSAGTRGRSAVLLSELVAVSRRRGARWRRGAAGGRSQLVAAVLGAAALALYMWGASERELKEAVARGEYAQAASLANR